MSDIHTDQLKIGERIFNSRLFIGTGKFFFGQAPVVMRSILAALKW